MNRQRDMRARLFRERSPAAFGMLTDPEPPVLAKATLPLSIDEAVRIAMGTFTVGAEEFRRADSLLRAGETAEAARAFETLIRDYPDSWIDRASRERLARLKA
jgi:hypothetical protein